MDFNLVVVAGMLAAPPDYGRTGRTDGQGARLLLTVRSNEPNPRVDLLPIAARVDQVPHGASHGEEFWVAGSLQRRFSSITGRSRLEVVAHNISRRDSGDECGRDGDGG